MASKDQAIGALIFLFCLIVAIGYVIIVAYPQAVNQVLGTTWDPSAVQFWAVAVVVLVAFLAIMFIGAWIGWTMATTPPPKPIEELEKETAEEKPKEEETPAEQKTENPASGTGTRNRKRAKKTE